MKAFCNLALMFALLFGASMARGDQLVVTTNAQNFVMAPEPEPDTLTVKVVQPDPLPAATVGEWAQFIASLGAAQGLSVFGIAGLVVQLLLLLARTNLDLTSKAKLGTVTGLSVGIATPALMAVGLDWSSAIVHSGTLAALQVFANQVYKQFFKKDDGKVLR